MNDVSDRTKAVKSVGGYVITHAGVLTKRDSQAFSFADTAEIRAALSSWLSFTRGLWCSPVFWNSRTHNWAFYSVPRLSPWCSVRSWFPQLHCHRVPSIFPRLARLLADPIWRDPLKLAIHWYVHSNECAGGIEGSLVLTQTAFEMLAWTYLVEHTGVFTPQSWDRLPGASTGIERLLGELGIPIGLPATHCPNLYAWVQSTNTGSSGPKALVKIRNAISTQTRRT
jgi:hypothetical protein